jgi:hypothetical protein
MKNLLTPIFLLILWSCNPNKPKVVEEFNPDGTIKSQTTLVNGMKNGISKTYDEQGRLKSTAEYVNDRKEGWLYNYNPLNGKITAKAFYKNDQQNGTVNLYYTNGEIYREMKYVNGRLDSVVKTYYPGNKLQAENLFSMGQASINLKEYDLKGNLITKYPTIQAREEDMRSTKGKFRVRLSLSNDCDKVDYYLNAVGSDGFINEKAQSIPSKDGIGFLDYNLPRGASFSASLDLVAKYKTELGNTKILQKKYKLNIR